MSSLRRTRKLLSLTLGVARPANARVLLRNAQDLRRPQPWARYIERTGLTYSDVLDRSTAWLCHSQDVVGSGGVGCYEFGGWTTGYPEVTGYIIPTIWDCQRLLGREDLATRAVRMTDWELSIQKPEGGFEGFYEGDGQPPIVFNTGQVIRGLLSSFAATQDSRYLEAAMRAGDWIVTVQEPDGSWGAANYLGRKRVYDTYVAAPLAQLAEVTGNSAYRRAAAASCEFALRHRQPNGWFALSDNSPSRNATPVTHTLCYTIDGLLEAGQRLGEERYVEAASESARAMAGGLEPSGRLPGRFDGEWRPAAGYVCVTGAAQLGVILMKLAEREQPGHARQQAARIADFLAYVQDLDSVSQNHAGGLPGSYPVWGRYVPLKYPSWAVKYFADLLVLLLTGP